MNCNTPFEFKNNIVVMDVRRPDEKYVLHYGWYMYHYNEQIGWYLSHIPDNVKFPLCDEDIYYLRPLSCDNLKPIPCPHPKPGPPPPRPNEEIDRSFITVDTKAQRNRLNTKLLPHGKIVRVNDTGDGKVGYFEWDQVHEVWKVLDLGEIEDVLFSKADERYAGKSDLEEIKDIVENVDISRRWCELDESDG